MAQNPDPSKMSERERTEWHEARRDEPRPGRILKGHTRTVADAHLSVRLNSDQIARLRQLSDIEGLSVSALVRHIVEEELSRRLPAQSPTHNGFVGHVTGSFWPPPLETTGSTLPENEIDHEIRMIA